MRTKIFSATCENGVVKVSGVVVAATVLTQGAGDSSGMFILEGDIGFYVAQNSTDIADLIDQVTAALSAAASGLTAIAGGMLGSATAPPGSLPGKVADINAAVSELNSIKENLK